MDNQQLTVPARYVTAMLTIAADRNCDTDVLLKSIGIKHQDILDGKPISVLMYGELHHHIIELVQDEWFGMLSGGPVPNGAIRLLGQSIVHCKNLRHALDRACTFFELCRGFKVKASYQLDGDFATIVLSKLDCIEQQEFDELMKNTTPETIKSTMSVWHGFFSWLIGKHIPLNDIYYSFDNDDPQQIHHKRNSTIYHYNHPFIGHRFNIKYLEYPIVQNENNLEDFMRKAPYYGLIKKNTEQGLAHHVKSMLIKSIGSELPNASEVAEAFNMSVTTLHRHLGNEGQSFQTLKNESRMEAAIHYLNCPEMSTAVISDLLSFENPSTFYRSFKKWTGLPPGQYRKKLLMKSDN